MKNLFASKKNEKGQGLVEYALILVLVAVVVIAVLTALGPRVDDAMMSIGVSLDCSKAAENVKASGALGGGSGDYDYPLTNAAMAKCGVDG